jgi:16S rRNA processing protein RimM
MEKSQCFELGYLSKVHGLDGALTAVLDTDQPERYSRVDALFLEQGTQLVPFLVEKVSGRKGNQLILHLEGVDSQEKANHLKGCKIWLPEKVLPILSKNQFYYHELIGAEVEDARHGKLGSIKEVLDLPQQTLASMDWQGSEILFPLNDAFIREFDRDACILRTDLPEGLIEVYLNPETEEDRAH